MLENGVVWAPMAPAVGHSVQPELLCTYHVLVCVQEGHPLGPPTVACAARAFSSVLRGALPGIPVARSIVIADLGRPDVVGQHLPSERLGHSSKVGDLPAASRISVVVYVHVVDADHQVEMNPLSQPLRAVGNTNGVAPSSVRRRRPSACHQAEGLLRWPVWQS